ncbi:UDP-N-acetyl-D-glucosamine dehydrogenase [Aliifodinibius salipaludis]|uniref:UDP-N-acetyl-D-glucosamine dehydrogenase n=1 Tax=Fodinibius salipaludis TaxID=2032627 RepID=A0A2A2G8I6_9BACT|nr:nucleotide sugar dehydrogenase [Aliifodinibius salipaludis]PAU93159.1 UDP-N-acetyl-D-glucosamine dehydrogenase [Aliifodinibius salipaludis]
MSTDSANIIQEEKKTDRLQKLLDKIKQRNYTVGIVGLGYVGLPLMWTFHSNDMPVLGFDIDKEKINCLKEGRPYIKHLGKEMMQKLADSKKCDATTDFSRISEADALLLCVPTPLDYHREPDMQYVEKTCMTVGEHLREGQLVILESTTYPGTTEELVIPILESKSGLTAGEDFYVAYSPEREDPGNINFDTGSIPKVVGGHAKEGIELACALYDTSIVRTVPVSDTKTAEAVKITENVFRAVNIALVNELKVVFSDMDIDVHEVLDAADTKPFGFMKFVPGPGLGGHCIPIDPFYLTWKAREYEQNTRFIELAGEINTSMPQYVIDQTLKALNAHKKPMNGSDILVIGLAYKPDVDDMRESPTFKIMDLLKEYGAEVSYYDPHIPEIKPTREHDEWTGTKSISWNKEVVSGYDAVVISTDHSVIDYEELAEWSDCIIDSRNALKGIEPDNDIHFWKA